MIESNVEAGVMLGVVACTYWIEYIFRPRGVDNQRTWESVVGVLLLLLG